jgi:ribonuclease J
LFVQKVQVIGGRGQNVHVSGHASQEEAKFMLTLAKPRSFVPSHGEERQLVIHGSFAETMGISPNDIHILKNGDVLELREQVARVKNKIPAQSIYYNHAKGLDIDEITMKERQSLSAEGTITVALTLDEKRNIIAGPEILAEACSFAKGKDWRAFCLGTVELIKDAIKQAIERKETESLNFKSVIRDTVNKSVLELISKRPLINVAIQEITH